MFLVNRVSGVLWKMFCSESRRPNTQTHLPCPVWWPFWQHPTPFGSDIRDCSRTQRQLEGDMNRHGHMFTLRWRSTWCTSWNLMGVALLARTRDWGCVMKCGLGCRLTWGAWACWQHWAAWPWGWRCSFLRLVQRGDVRPESKNKSSVGPDTASKYQHFSTSKQIKEIMTDFGRKTSPVHPFTHLRSGCRGGTSVEIH